jgi:hypothetical protein
VRKAEILTTRELGLILGALYRAEVLEAEIASDVHHETSIRRTATRLMARSSDLIEKIQGMRKHVR